MNSKSLLLAFTVLTLSASLGISASAQQRTKRTDPNTWYRAPSTMTGKMIILPIGTTIEGRLSQTLSSCKSHAGQSFSVTLAAPVLANGIDVVVPAGSEIVGEVVEAIPSSKQERKKGMPKPKGKLRIQITQLRTPDGTAFPLVANLVGEEEGKNSRGRSRLQTQYGQGVGYVGTSEAFEAVAPGAKRYGQTYGPNKGPDYVKKREFLAHEIYGTGGQNYDDAQDKRIRSLVLRKQDLWIDQGSPLTVRLQAPLRISLTPNNAGAPVGAAPQNPGGDDLPPPSASSGVSDIPPINSDPGADAPPPPPRRIAPDAAPPQPSVSPPQAPPQNPGASPSADF